jgi:hypothetical protein
MKLRECLSTGTYALVSHEILEKEPRRNEIIDGEYVSVVEDPTDVDSIERVLDKLISSGLHIAKRATLCAYSQKRGRGRPGAQGGSRSHS